MKRILLTLALFAFIISHAFAQTVTPAPPLMNFQGRLAKPDGTPVADGTYTLTFRLYNQQIGGTLKWDEQIGSVVTRNGIFSCVLGNVFPFSETVLNGTVWLEIQINDAPPLIPRQRLYSVAYALKANTVPDNAITTTKIADGAITQAKLAAGVGGTPGGPAGGDLTGTYPNPTIANNAILTAKLADAAITAAKLSNNAVASAKLADLAVSAAKLADSAVTTLKIADGAVTTTKIASGAVTSDKIAPLSVMNSAIVSVDYSKITNAPVGAGVPPGTVVAFAGNTVPNGYLLCDGSAVSRTTYPALFSAVSVAHGIGDAVTTFNLPDYRGLFLRMVDGSAGRDPDSASRTAMAVGGNIGNIIGSIQLDQLKSHQHGYLQPNVFGPRADYGPTDGPFVLSEGGVTSPFGGNETRPKNAYVYYIIKY